MHGYISLIILSGERPSRMQNTFRQTPTLLKCLAASNEKLIKTSNISELSFVSATRDRLAIVSFLWQPFVCGKSLLDGTLLYLKVRVFEVLWLSNFEPSTRLHLQEMRTRSHLSFCVTLGGWKISKTHKSSWRIGVLSYWIHSEKVNGKILKNFGKFSDFFWKNLKKNLNIFLKNTFFTKKCFFSQNCYS